MSTESYIQQILQTLTNELDNLESTISDATKKIESFSIGQIIQMYYQITNVTSVIEFLNQYSKDSSINDEKVENKIKKATMIIEQFNNNIHPQVQNQLKKLIEKSMADLKDMKNNTKKEKSNIENQAGLYENLREMMSTKEFVEQYNKNLK